MTLFRGACSEIGPKHATLSSITALSSFARRHNWPYMCGIICFARLSLALLLDEERHQGGELDEIGHTEHRAAPAKDELRIGGDDVGPLPRHRADAVLVDAQQEPRPIPVVSLAQADELPPAERVERVGHPHKARISLRKGCSSG